MSGSASKTTAQGVGTGDMGGGGPTARIAAGQVALCTEVGTRLRTAITKSQGGPGTRAGAEREPWARQRDEERQACKAAAAIMRRPEKANENGKGNRNGGTLIETESADVKMRDDRESGARERSESTANERRGRFPSYLVV